MPSWPTFAVPMATYVGGVLTKPLQAAIEEWRVRRKLRASLYADLGQNLDAAGSRMRILLKIPDAYDDILPNFVKDSFAQALSDPSLFHQLQESKRIRLFYEIMDTIGNTTGEKEMLGTMGLLIRNVASGIKAGDYRRNLVYRQVSQETRNMIDERERGLKG